MFVWSVYVLKYLLGTVVLTKAVFSEASPLEGCPSASLRKNVFYFFIFLCVFDTSPS